MLDRLWVVKFHDMGGRGMAGARAFEARGKLFAILGAAEAGPYRFNSHLHVFFSPESNSIFFANFEDLALADIWLMSGGNWARAFEAQAGLEQEGRTFLAGKRQDAVTAEVGPYGSSAQSQRHIGG